MSSSYSSSRTSSGSCSCLKKEPEVTLDDVATVLADLNTKVSQLRREILALKDYSVAKRSKGRAGNGSLETVQKKVATRQPFQTKEEYFPRRKIRSQLISRKESKLRYETDPSSSTPHSSQSIQITNHRAATDGKETRNVSFALRKPHGQLTISPSTSEKFTVCINKPITINKQENLSGESCSRNQSAKSKDETFCGKSHEGKKHRHFHISRIEKSLKESSGSDKSRRKVENRTSFRRILKERLRPVFPKRGETNNTYLSNRQHWPGNQNGHMDVNEMEYNSDKSNREDEMKAIIKHGNRRIVLPSRVSMRCQGIRHAFGLSNLYCNCDHTGSAARHERMKKISRGVQCDAPNAGKYKRYCGLAVCFGFKGCNKKSVIPRERNSRISGKTEKGAESLEIYKPKEKSSTKEGCVIEKNGVHQIRDMRESKTRRMTGRTDKNNVREFKRPETFPPKQFYKYGDAQRHRGDARRKNEAANDRCINKNDVKNIKQRLNNCLLELNGIIGEMGMILQDSEKYP